MLKTSIAQKADLHFLLYGALAWAAAALVLLPISAFIIRKAGVSAGAIGYISSALSFIAAAAAGAFAGKKRGGGSLFGGAVTAAVIVILLLTIGFIVKGAELSPSGVMSVVSFTFSGCLFGAVFFSGGIKRSKKSRFSPTRRR